MPTPLELRFETARSTVDIDLTLQLAAVFAGVREYFEQLLAQRTDR